jgi:thermostable 8-oxoguanine DNA glycosylase
MLLIPKHIYTLISTIESELHKKETPSARFYLSDIQEIKRSIAGLSHAEYNHLHLRLMLMNIQKIIK